MVIKRLKNILTQTFCWSLNIPIYGKKKDLTKLVQGWPQVISGWKEVPKEFTKKVCSHCFSQF